MSPQSLPTPTPKVHPDLAAHAARFVAKIVQTGARTHTLIGYNIANVSIIDAPEGLILVDAMAQEDDARPPGDDRADPGLAAHNTRTAASQRMKMATRGLT